MMQNREKKREREREKKEKLVCVISAGRAGGETGGVLIIPPPVSPPVASPFIVSSRSSTILHDPLIARFERNELGSEWEAGQFVPERRHHLDSTTDGSLEGEKNSTLDETKQLRFILLIGFGSVRFIR